MQSITLPQSLINIGACAFEASGLRNISIPASVIYIAGRAFNFCEHLTTVTLAEGGEKLNIADLAFSDCSSLETVTLPYSFLYFNTDAFSGSNVYELENGVYYLGNWVVGYDWNHTLGAVTLREGTVGIAKSAFANCQTLTAITIPASVKQIGEHAFRDCKNLQAVVFAQNSTLKEIGDCAFEYCDELTAISIPTSVTEIGLRAFYGTKVLEEENGVIYADKWVVDTTSGISVTVTLREDTVGIAAYAFEWFIALQSITLPNSLKSIGYGAFADCCSLKSIVIPDTVVHIGYEAFYRCTALTSVTLPTGLTTLESGLFTDCDSLQSIVIPAAVTTIRGNAFSDCEQLTSITFQSLGNWEYIYTNIDAALIDDVSYYGNGFVDNTIQHANLSAQELADPATVAAYFKNTYNKADYCWLRAN